MKLEIFDPYIIRARLCPSIILLGPIALTIFFCFDELYSFITSTITVCILFALTNYITVLQRRLAPHNQLVYNYAAKYLLPDDTTIDSISKKRYYSKLASLEDTFSSFITPTPSQDLCILCESAVVYLRNITRDNHLVLEENINCGFCKNMLISKPIGIIINCCLATLTIVYSLATYKTFECIPPQNLFSLGINAFFILFWFFGITRKMMEEASKRYALALITAIDSVSIISNSSGDNNQ